MRLTPTAKAFISLIFSVTVLGAGILWTWQNIVIPFRTDPPRPDFAPTNPKQSRNHSRISDFLENWH